MLAWANVEALEKSVASGRMHYWSRSRGKQWRKGEESGNEQQVVRLAADCDGDAVLALVHQTGPACHTKTATCFGDADDTVPRPVLAELARIIVDRKSKPPEGSYTAKLVADAKLATEKVQEEAEEVVRAIRSESDERVAEEAADVLYHLLVACETRNVGLAKILRVLEERRR